MARVVLTGATGFIGTHLLHACLEAGDECAITSRVHFDHPDAEVFEVDIRHRDRCRVLTDWKPEVVYHLAAYHHVGRSFQQPEECFDVNAKGSANIIDACPDAHVVYMSSSEVYGHQHSVPWTEDLLPRPQSPYAVTKYAGECHALQAHRQGRRVTAVRPFNVFGPGQSEHAVIGEFIRRALAGEVIHTTPGQQTREFNYVTNIVDGLRAVVSKAYLGGPINLAGGEEIAVSDLLHEIIVRTDSGSEVFTDLPHRPNEIWRMRGSSVLAEMELGWTPAVSFSDGLDKTIAWYRENYHPCEGGQDGWMASHR